MAAFRICGRPGAPWLWRAVVLLGTAWLAWHAFVDALAQQSSPYRADAMLRLAPRDPDALVNEAFADMLVARSRPAARQVFARCRESIAAQPINPRALQICGFARDMTGEDGAPAILLAERQSRREMMTQYWLIQYSVDHGDAGAAMRHYDILLRTRPDTRRMLLPVLVRALSQPSTWPLLRRVTSIDPPWWPAFLDQAIYHGDPVILARFLVYRHGPGNGAGADVAEGQLLTRLADLGAFGAAADYLAGAAPARGPHLRRIGRSGADGDPRFGPFAWQTTPAGSRRKLLLLPPGHYRLTLAGDGQVAGRWQATCADTGLALLDWQAEGVEAAQADIVVPNRCAAQSIVVTAPLEDLDATIDGAKLMAVGKGG